MPKVYDVFISYRRSDGAITANELKAYLTGKGVRAFLDTDDLVPGEKFTDRLQGAVMSIPHYILIGTPNAFAFREENKAIGDLDFVQDEIRTALAVCNKSADHTFTVLFVNGCSVPEREDLPEDVRELADYNHIIETQNKSSVRMTEQTKAADFEKVLSLVTRVSRANLWHASHRKLENEKKHGGRFAALDICDKIFPNARMNGKKADFPIDVKTDRQSDSLTPLMDAINASDGNLYLIGEGGIGKTTALVKIMEEDFKNGYSDGCRVPIFVELSFAPDSKGEWLEGDRSTFILRSVYKQILDRRAEEQGSFGSLNRLKDVMNMSAEAASDPVETLFRQQTDKPEYLLLLDGLNEVSHAKINDGRGFSVIDRIIDEINYLIARCPNVRIILTSRSDNSSVLFEDFERYYLPGLDDEQIKNYLSDPERGLPAERINNALENKDLMNTLRVPLFLTLYAGLQNADGITTQGEILYEFFHERSENIYTAQDRLAAVGKNFSYSEPAVEGAHLTAEMQIFILELILPQIGYDMGSNEAFSFKAKQLRESAVKIIKGKSITDECGEYGEDVFPIRGRLGAEKAPAEIVEALRKAFYPRFPSNDQIENINEADRAAAGAIVKCLAEEIGILYRISKDEYGFIHQHFRDYFSAVKYINVMKLAEYLSDNKEKEAALDLTGRYLKDEPVSLQLRRFIGEISGEHHNRPYRENKTWKLPRSAEKSLIMKTLDIYRGEDHNAAGYAVYSLVHILNEARNDLSGCDFSHIDLTGCNFGGIRLSRKNLPSILNGAILHGKNLIYEGHTGLITSICVSPDGKYILTASTEGTVKIWDSRTLRLINTLRVNSFGVTSAAYSPADSDGVWRNKRIITASKDGCVREWDAESLEPLGVLIGHNKTILNSAAYSPDGKRIMVLDYHAIQFFNAETYEPLGGIDILVQSAAFSPDGKRIVATRFNTAEIWDSESLEPLGELTEHTGNIQEAIFSPDGKRIVTASWDNTAKVWDAYSFKLRGTLKSHTGWVNSAAFSPDGKRIVTVSRDGTIRVWGADSGSLLKTIECHAFKAVYSSDGNRIIAMHGTSLFIYEANNYILKENVIGKDNSVVSAVFSPDGTRILTTSQSGTVQKWDSENFDLLGDAECYESTSASYSPNGKRIITYGGSILGAENFENFGILEGRSASYSPDCKHIITVSSDTLMIWDAESFKPIGTRTCIGNVRSAVYSPDGKSIATTSSDTIQIWDAESFKPLGRFRCGYEVRSAIYSPDSKSIVTTGLTDDFAKVWSSENFELLGTLKDHESFINSVAFSPDGTRIVTASYDKTVKIWGTKSFDPLGTLIGHSSSVNSARYNSDGTLIITSSDDGTVKIWDAETFKPLKTMICIPGLDIMGVDFAALDQRSDFSPEEIKLVSRYGGVIKFAEPTAPETIRRGLFCGRFASAKSKLQNKADKSLKRGLLGSKFEFGPLSITLPQGFKTDSWMANKAIKNLGEKVAVYNDYPEHSDNITFNRGGINDKFSDFNVVNIKSSIRINSDNFDDFTLKKKRFKDYSLALTSYSAELSGITVKIKDYTYFIPGEAPVFIEFGSVSGEFDEAFELSAESITLNLNK